MSLAGMHWQVHIQRRIRETPDYLHGSPGVVQSFQQCHPQVLEFPGLLTMLGPGPIARQIFVADQVLEDDPSFRFHTVSIIFPIRGESKRKESNLFTAIQGKKPTRNGRSVQRDVLGGGGFGAGVAGQFLPQVIDLLLERLGLGGSALSHFQVPDGLCEMMVLFLDAGQVDGDLLHRPRVGLLLGGFLLPPAAQGQFPNVSRAVGVMVILLTKPAQLEEDFIAVGVLAQPFAQESSPQYTRQRPGSQSRLPSRQH